MKVAQLVRLSTIRTTSEVDLAYCTLVGKIIILLLLFR